MPPLIHVHDVERSIQTIKERVRCTIHDLPYEYYPKPMVEGCIYKATKQLNDELTDTGIGNGTMSAANLILGRPNPNYKALTKLQFGMYVQVKTDDTITNDNKYRTVGAIALYPGDDRVGSWFFMSLVSGKRIHASQWTKCHITKEVIDRVHDIAKKQGQSRIVNENFIFQWRDKTPIEDSNDESDVIEVTGAADINPPNNEPILPDIEVIDEVDNNPNDTPLMEDESQDNLTAPKIADSTVNEENNDDDSYEDQGALLEHDYDPALDGPDGDQLNDDANADVEEEAEVRNDATAVDNNNNGDDVGENNVENPINEDNDSIADTYEPPTLRPRNKVNYRSLHLKGTTEQVNAHVDNDLNQGAVDDDVSPISDKGAGKADPHEPKIKVTPPSKKTPQLTVRDTLKRIVHICFNQMSAKKGIEKHGQDAINALLKEFAQIHDLSVFHGIYKRDLTPEQLAQVLRMVTVIKEKRCGKIKGRACANGKKQRKWIPPEDASAPTVALESLIITLLIDAYENRDVATADVAGAFLKGILEDFVVVKLVNEEVDIMLMIDEKAYAPFVIQEGKNKVLYVKLDKALYGCLKAAIIWYVTFKNKLVKMGFKLNPYDPCVANAIINGRQCTIVWYVDDVKISHVEYDVVSWVIKEIQEEFGEMTVKRGKEHVYVGMNILFKDGAVEIRMKDYLLECIDVFGEDVSVGAVTPATRDLFEIDSESLALGEKRSTTFHHIVAKLLFVSLRARIDIILAIAFLCTRVSRSTEEDWAKLRRLLKYLHRTIDMPRIIRVDSFKFII